MFICNDCLTEHYINKPSFFTRIGTCEICTKITTCSDIPSGNLRARELEQIKVKKRPKVDKVLLVAMRGQEMEKEHPSCRKGQCFFNALHEFYPEIADKVTGTEADPFYDDSKITKCAEIIEEHNE